jgi:hypothetical protein
MVVLPSYKFKGERQAAESGDESGVGRYIADELIEVHVSQLDRLAGLDVCQFGFLETP